MIIIQYFYYLFIRYLDNLYQLTDDYELRGQVLELQNIEHGISKQGTRSKGVGLSEYNEQRMLKSFLLSKFCGSKFIIRYFSYPYNLPLLGGVWEGVLELSVETPP
jgi:hypothetical protein